MNALSIHALACAAALASALIVACQARANDPAPDRLATTQWKVEVVAAREAIAAWLARAAALPAWSRRPPQQPDLRARFYERLSLVQWRLQLQRELQ
jgi:hypothetical protein